MFYNTTNATNPELVEYRNKAFKQDDRIIKLFEDKPRSWTPSEVLIAAFRHAPITSIRRSMTNLTDQGKLKKTSEQREGLYGRPECVWVLVGKTEQMNLW